MTLHPEELGKSKLIEINEIIEKMIETVEVDKELKLTLENSEDWKSRWITLEKFVIENLDNFGLDFIRYQSLWIRERFFYEMQKRTSLDYGFCEFFIPVFKNKTESILTDNLKIDMSNKCNYGGKTLETTCSGTDRDNCVILHPEAKELRKNPHKYN